MRRKTVEVDINLPKQDRKPSKNKSYHWENKILNGTTNDNVKLQNIFGCSQTIVVLLVEDFLLALEPKFRQSDKKRYDSFLNSKIAAMENHLAKTLNPLGSQTIQNYRQMRAEEEPRSVSTDWICGGKIGQELRRAVTPSILSTQRKQEVKQVHVSKKSIASSKCLIRLSKEQHLQRKRSLEALKMSCSELADRHQELMKQKISKESKEKIANILFKTGYNQKNSKFNSTVNNLEEFSYDYDGSAIPIKRMGHRLGEKMYVLNTLCKVNNKEWNVPKKGRPLNKASPYHYFKTEADQTSRENSIPHEAINKLVEARKESVMKSINDLRGLSSRGEEDSELRTKFNEFIRTRAVKIRELKN